MTIAYDAETSSRELRALASQLLETTRSTKEMKSDDLIGQCFQSQIQDTEDAYTNNLTKLLLSLSRGDEIVAYCLETNLILEDILTPTTRNQAMKSPQKDRWIEAELESIQRKNVLQPAQLPGGKKLLKTK